METFIVLIALFLGGQQPELEIWGTYANHSTCEEDAKDLRIEAKQKRKPFRFYCRPASLTKA